MRILLTSKRESLDWGTIRSKKSMLPSWTRWPLNFVQGMWSALNEEWRKYLRLFTFSMGERNFTFTGAVIHVVVAGYLLWREIKHLRHDTNSPWKVAIIVIVAGVIATFVIRIIVRRIELEDRRKGPKRARRTI